ncbi:MAG: hypothetical protein WHV66_08395 [Anaerolineales bacterium]
MTFNHRQKISFSLFFLLTALESAWVFRQLLTIPADPRRAILGGYSPVRLGMLAIILLIGVGCLSLLVLLNYRARPPSMLLWLNQFLMQHDHAFWVFLLMLMTGYAMHFLNSMLVSGCFPEVQAVALRLAPVLSWMGWLSVQSALLLTLAHLEIEALRDFRREQNFFLRHCLICGVVLLAGFGLLEISSLGFHPDVTDWYFPNAPVLASQVWAGLVLGTIILWLAPRLPRHWFDIFLAGGLWLAAVLLWQTVPLEPSYFNPQPTPPNFEYYPYSDAKDYDWMAQTLLIGEGFGGGRLIFRPTYVFSLAIYHALVGQSYTKTMLIQVMVLASLPVIIYFLGKDIHSRLGGLLAASYILLRERNNIAIGGMIHGAHSHARLMMTDVPTELGVALIALLLVLWLKRKEHHHWLSLWIGGLLGALTLVRVQATSLSLALIASTLLLIRAQLKIRLSAVLQIALGTGLFFAPWLVRNYAISGMWVLETAPSAHIPYEVRHITGISNTALLPSERGDTYNARMMGIIRDYMLTHPIETLRFTTAHFFHNEVNMVLSLPLDNDSKGLKDYVNRHEFWFSPIEQIFPPSEQVMLGINLVVLGIGLGMAFARNKTAAWSLVFLHVSYNLGNALTRRSGGRFFLPVDWVGIFFYALGLAQILIWLALLWKVNLPFFMSIVDASDSITLPKLSQGRHSLLRGALVGVSVLVVGALLPLAELVVPPRYTQTAQQVIQTAPFTNADRLRLLNLLDIPETVAYYGRGIYPRYLKAGEGLRSSEPYRDQDRLRFEIIGAQSNEVFLPLAEPPVFFPSGSDVIAIGCIDKGYLDALVVIVLNDTDNYFYWRSKTVQPPPCTTTTAP